LVAIKQEFDNPLLHSIACLVQEYQHGELPLV
jgi:hypothetical protein